MSIVLIQVINIQNFGNVNNSFYAATNNKMLFLKNYGELDMNYYPTPKGFLKNMKLVLKTPMEMFSSV